MQFCCYSNWQLWFDEKNCRNFFGWKIRQNAAVFRGKFNNQEMKNLNIFAIFNFFFVKSNLLKVKNCKTATFSRIFRGKKINKFKNFSPKKFNFHVFCKKKFDNFSREIEVLRVKSTISRFIRKTFRQFSQKNLLIFGQKMTISNSVISCY